MYILLKEQIENYRYAVGKLIFLIEYNNLSLISDLKDSNSMLVFDEVKQKYFYISIFKKPTKEFEEDYPVQIFYQKGNINKKLSGKNKAEFFMLNPDFEKRYAEAIEAAFTDTKHFFQDIPPKYFDLFKYYFLIAEKKITEDMSAFYKYLSKKTVDRNNYQVNDGYLSFSHPKYFNDPFDCNYVLENNIDMSGKLRVLCLTKKFDNILMWSYYSDSHQGYCFELVKNSIVEKITGIGLTGLCVYGPVNYSKKRPEIKKQVKTFSFTDLMHYVDAAFTKYYDWKHEDECRFVIISNELVSDFISIQVDVSKVYEGCLGNESPVLNSSGESLNMIKLAKDDIGYRLNTH